MHRAPSQQPPPCDGTSDQQGGIRGGSQDILKLLDPLSLQIQQAEIQRRLLPAAAAHRHSSAASEAGRADLSAWQGACVDLLEMSVTAVGVIEGRGPRDLPRCSDQVRGRS